MKLYSNKNRASFTFAVRMFYYFFIVTIDVFIPNTDKCKNFIGFIVRVINQE